MKRSIEILPSLNVLTGLIGAEKPTKNRVKKIEKLANQAEITLTRKEIARFDRDLTEDLYG